MRNQIVSSALLLQSTARVLAVISLASAPIAIREISAQSAKSIVNVRDVGTGAETWVLLPGTLGGVYSMHRLESRLLAGGARVVTIDVYGLSIDSADVSFAALARRVDATLSNLHVDRAHVVGHAHGGGVALRLAASFPNRVSAVDLLDVGALAANRTAAMSGAIGLVPLLSRMPGGRAFIRTRLVNGIRENSGTTQWFDIETERAYTNPVLDNVGRVIAMAERLGRVQEPESIAAVVQRVRVPVTVVLGQAPHSNAPGAEQLIALASLGSRLHVVRLNGVGHFLHEEAPDQVMRALKVVVASAVTGNDK